MEANLGAYFYPLTTSCGIRRERTIRLGRSPTDETALVQSASPLFKGHRQPNTFTIGGGICQWDDSNPSVMARQIDIAREYGLGYWIFDTYAGGRNGRLVQEVAQPINTFLSLSPQLRFALMISQNAPRAILPIGKEKEPGRSYILNATIARDLVDLLVQKYFHSENYLQINGKPYLSLWVADALADHKNGSDTRAFLEELQEYAEVEYGVSLHLVGVIKKISDKDAYIESGIKSLTGYAFLPNFDAHGKPIQHYDELLSQRQNEWEVLRREKDVTFSPPAVVGWDASPRGERGYALYDVQGRYPYVPIVESTPEQFGQMLRRVLEYVRENLPIEEQYPLICAWNEISEGCALLPRVREDGVVDWGYLEAVRQVIRE